MTSYPLRLRIGAASLLIGAIALLGAQLLRPDHGEDARTILRAVTDAPGAAPTASLLYLAAAVMLVSGLIALPSAVATGRGSRLLFVSTAVTAVGVLWFAVEAALMIFADVLATSSDAAAAATQLDALNAGFGVLAALPWFFYIGPLGIAMALRRADLVGAWLIGLWVVGFVTGFAANSPLGESVPALVVANDVLVAALLVGTATAVARATRQHSTRAPVGVSAPSRA